MHIALVGLTCCCTAAMPGRVITDNELWKECGLEADVQLLLHTYYTHLIAHWNIPDRTLLTSAIVRKLHAKLFF